MKKAYLFAFTLLDWQRFSVDNRLAVQLPIQPTEADLAKLAPGKSMPHVRLWMARLPEGGYQVIRIPNTFTIGRTDTARRRSFYAGVLTSLLRNENGQLLALSPFQTNAGTGVEIKYKALHRGTKKRVIKYVRSLVIDSVSYSFNFISADNQDSTGTSGSEQRQHFFNSITVKPNPAALIGPR